MKHIRAFWTKKQRQKAQIKREGTKKSTTFLYLISAIFRVRPHVFINIASDIIQGDLPNLPNINQLCVNYSIVSQSAPHLSLLHSASQPHLLISPTPYTCLCSTLPVGHAPSSDQLPTPVSAPLSQSATPPHETNSLHLSLLHATCEPCLLIRLNAPHL